MFVLPLHVFQLACFFIILVLGKSVANGVECSYMQDAYVKPVITVNLAKGTLAGNAVSVFCGEDAADAASRIATTRKTRQTDSHLVLDLANTLQAELEKSNYKPLVTADVGRTNARPRILQTGGMYSRRASEFKSKEEYAPACADLLRALMRPKLAATSREKLHSLLSDILKASSGKIAKLAADGDLLALFETLEMEDDPASLDAVDMKALKRRYRDLSIKYHPDKGSASAERFNEIRDAYEILSDPVKQMLFDTGGMEIVKKYEGSSGELERSENMEIDLQVSLKDVYTGTSSKTRRSRRTVCRSCRLHPNLARCKKCQRCPGEMKQRHRWLNQHQYTIEEYEEQSNDKCRTQTEEIDITVEKGLNNGDRVNFAGRASQKPKQIPGDIMVNVKIAKHPVFKRIASDLIVNTKVSLYEALLGFQREIVHLDGHIVKFSLERGTVLQPGFVLQIADEGMPKREDPSSYGRMLVNFEIEFPDVIPQNGLTGLENALRAVGQTQKGVRVNKGQSGERKIEL